MKFTCPKCSTKYSIADDRVPPDKTLRFTCKKCSNAIRLRRKTKAPESPQAMPEASTRIAGLDEINALKSDSKFGEHAIQAPPAPPAQKSQTPAGKASTSATNGMQDHDWFFLSDGAQKGPLAFAELEALARRGEVDEKTYVWHEGLDDWIRLGTTPIYRSPSSSGQSAGGSLAAIEDHEATVAMNPQQLAAELARARAEKEDEPVGPDPERSTPSAKTVTLPAPGREAVGTESKNWFTGRAEAESETPDAPHAFPTQEHGSNGHQDLNGEDMPPSSREPLSSPGGGGAPFDAGAHPPSGLESTPASTPEGAYLQAPPGEATRVFMAASGIYKRRRFNRIAAVVGGLLATLLVGTISLDIAGVIELPGMGLMYDMTGLVDPNTDRARARVEEQLAEPELTPEERKRLRARLLGLGGKGRSSAGREPARRKASGPTIGIQAEEKLPATEKELAASVFGDTRKSEAQVDLQPPDEVVTPNLPEGLTQESIVKVIGENNRSMSLCVSQAMKAGEKLSGRMELELTINATGTVTQANVGTQRFRTSVMGSCATKTVKRWKFPRFNGEPVTVVFPYLLSVAF